jgi:hypothetical protein
MSKQQAYVNISENMGELERTLLRTTVILCRFEVSSVIVRGEYWLRVFENRVLRRMFGTKRGKVAGK